ncbi:hypothetical protein [Streptomyces marianii]|uniref:Bro-N domain-containing protein n=1 Tax=Streptomyces marianii TaxID=1817406 RepID=A0A5R9DRR3_9ACTN|nr:hypothetical protein [Streptomyces marianii]TLQ39280.1 hypothetical protein FEF34_38455 [Streptomyces marianii]
MSSRPAPASQGRWPGRHRRATITVFYRSAPLRVRVDNGQVLWFVRDLGPAIGFRRPLTPGRAVPQILLTTTELWSAMTTAGFRPPCEFVAWAQDLPGRLA